MQDEASQQTIALMIQGGKISAEILKQAIVKMQMYSSNLSNNIKAAGEKEGDVKHGKQSLSSLMEHKAELTNIPIDENNIGDFEKIAKKYDMDYSLKKDKSQEPPVYIVFFKARDAGVMEQALKEYTRDYLNKDHSRVSVRQKLKEKQDLIRQQKDIGEKIRTVAKYKETER